MAGAPGRTDFSGTAIRQPLKDVSQDEANKHWRRLQPLDALGTLGTVCTNRAHAHPYFVKTSRISRNSPELPQVLT